MCFTLAGRLQTRLIALIGPLFLACAFTALSGDRVYLTLFALMSLLALVLDASVYHWLIGFQPRWLTIALGALEFGLLLLLAPGLADLGQMAGFYIPAWLSSWLTLEIALPLAWPRWMEDGGELRPAGSRPALRTRIPESLSDRRKVFAVALLSLAIAGLPWIAGAMLTPPLYHFTGVLWLPEAHLPAIQQTLAAIRGESLFPTGIQFGQNLLSDALWLMAMVAWLLGVRARAGSQTNLPWPIAALLIPTFLPAPFVAILAAAVWLLPALPWRWLLESLAPKLILALLVIVIGSRLLEGELPAYHLLLTLAVVAWLLVVLPRSRATSPAVWLAAIVLSPLVLPAPLVALLAVAMWPFLPLTWHWLPRSIVPALALGVYLVWSAAQAGAIDALWVYHLLWIGAAFAWLMGVVIAYTIRDVPSAYWLAAAALVPLALPIPLIALLAVLVWTRRMWPSLPLMRIAVPALALLALVIWGLAWAQLGAQQQSASAPAYLGADRWAMAKWLRENAAFGSVMPLFGDIDNVTIALGGHRIDPEPSSARFCLSAGQYCTEGIVRFQQGGLCLVEGSAP
jgi:hypothetical protein